MERYIGLWGLIFLILSIVLQNVNLVDCFVWYGDQRQLLHAPSVRQRIMNQHLPEETTPSPFPYTFWRRRRTSTHYYGNTKQKLQSVFVKDGRLLQLQKLENQLAHKVRLHPRAALTYFARSSKTRVPYYKQYQIRKFKDMKTAIPESSNQYVISPRIVSRFIINGRTNRKPPNEVNSGILPKITGHTGILKQRNWYHTVTNSQNKANVVSSRDSLYDISRLKTQLSNLNTNWNGYVGIPDETFRYFVEFSRTKPKISKGQFKNILNIAYTNKHQKFAEEVAGVNSIASSTESGVASLDELGESNDSQNSHKSHLSDSMSFNGDSNIFRDAVIDVESLCDGIDTKTCILDSDCRLVCDGLHKCYRHLCIVLGHSESDIPTTSMVRKWQDEPLENMRERRDEII